MITLPKNELKSYENTPTKFLIWGQSMSGKTYLARQFPNVLILNTDGNGAKIPEPTIEITSFEDFMEAIELIEKGNHTFETITIDLIDDIATMMEDFICRKNSDPNKNIVYTSLAEIPYGKGFSERKAIWKALMMRLSQMKYNIIMISHYIEIKDGENTIPQPSLDQVYLNMSKGRCDAYIRCSKIGSTYIQKCEERRNVYVLSDVNDERVREALKNVRGLFDDVSNTPVIKPINAVKKESLPANKTGEETTQNEETKKPTKPMLKKIEE